MPANIDLSTTTENWWKYVLGSVHHEDAMSRGNFVCAGHIYDIDEEYPDAVMAPPTQLAIDEALDGTDPDDGLPLYDEDPNFELEEELENRYDHDAWRRELEIEKLLLDNPREADLEQSAAAHTAPRITRGMRKDAAYSRRKERRSVRASRNDGKRRYSSNRRDYFKKMQRIMRHYFEETVARYELVSSDDLIRIDDELVAA